MNDMQLYLSIGIPTFAVLLAWVSNRSDINRVNDKLDRITETLRTEMLAFRKENANEMIAFRREVHGDLMMLHERVVKVEARQDA